MDYDLIRAGLEQAVPFNSHVGLEIVEVSEGRGVVRLPDAEGLRNHVGSQHASALFAAGEAASGAAFISAFAEHLESIEPLAESAEIQYRTIARGPITAIGVLGANPSELLDELAREERARFAIDVSLVDGAGVTVADMTVRWHVRRDA